MQQLVEFIGKLKHGKNKTVFEFNGSGNKPYTPIPEVETELNEAMAASQIKILILESVDAELTKAFFSAIQQTKTLYGISLKNTPSEACYQLLENLPPHIVLLEFENLDSEAITVSFQYVRNNKNLKYFNIVKTRNMVRETLNQLQGCPHIQTIRFFKYERLPLAEVIEGLNNNAHVQTIFFDSLLDGTELEHLQKHLKPELELKLNLPAKQAPKQIRAAIRSQEKQVEKEQTPNETEAKKPESVSNISIEKTGELAAVVTTIESQSGKTEQTKVTSPIPSVSPQPMVLPTVTNHEQSNSEPGEILPTSNQNEEKKPDNTIKTVRSHDDGKTNSRRSDDISRSRSRDRDYSESKRHSSLRHKWDYDQSTRRYRDSRWRPGFHSHRYEDRFNDDRHYRPSTNNRKKDQKSEHHLEVDNSKDINLLKRKYETTPPNKADEKNISLPENLNKKVKENGSETSTSPMRVELTPTSAFKLDQATQTPAPVESSVSSQDSTSSNTSAVNYDPKEIAELNTAWMNLSRQYIELSTQNKCQAMENKQLKDMNNHLLSVLEQLADKYPQKIQSMTNIPENFEQLKQDKPAAPANTETLQPTSLPPVGKANYRYSMMPPLPTPSAKKPKPKPAKISLLIPEEKRLLTTFRNKR